MALRKTILDAKGLETNYHKIRSISVFPTYMNIEVDDYASEEHRNLEKEYYASVKRCEEIQTILLDVEKDNEEATALQSELQELKSILKENSAHSYLALNNTIITVPFDVEVSVFGFANVYNILKEQELFNGAENC